MNTKYNVMKFMVIVLAFVVVAGGFYLLKDKLPEGKDADKANPKGIYVINEDGKVIDSYTVGIEIITVSEDNCTVTGTADKRTMISVEEGVRNVTIENLDCGDKKVDININEEKNDTTLVFKGINNVSELYSFGNIIVKAESQDDELNIKYSLEGERIDILSGTVRASYIYSFDNVNITGEPAVYLTGEYEGEDNFSFSALEADGKLTVDLQGKGVLQIDRGKVFDDAVFTYKGIVLGDNTEIVEPSSGYIALWDDTYDEEYSVFDENDEAATKLVIKAK